MELQIILIVSAVVVLLVVALIIVGVSTSNKNNDINKNHHIHFSSSSGDELTYEEYKGFYAERSVASSLSNLSLIIDGSHVINSVTIPSGKDKNGVQRTIEIDHILFTRSGLFVIETKSRAGRIYGDIDDDNWYQVLGRYDNIEHKFYNPIKQNNTHIRVLKRLLRNDNLKCFSLIVFEDGNIRGIDSDQVITKDELNKKIKESIGNQVYSQQDVDGFYTRIKYYKDHPPVTKEQHIKNVHSRDYDA